MRIRQQSVMPSILEYKNGVDDMRKYSLFHGFWMSFFSRQFYLDVLNNWKGASFIFLIMLVAVVTVPVSVQLKKAINEVLDETPALVSQVPEIRITGGIVSTPRPAPYAVRDKAGKTVAIIDTSGRYKTIEAAGAPLLVTRTGLIFKKSEFETREYNFSSISDLTITGDIINHWIGLFDTWILVVLVPFIFMGMYAYYLMAALCYSLIALVVSSFVKVRTAYTSKLSCAIVAMTPASLIFAVCDLLSFEVPNEFYFSFIVTTGLILYGIYSNRSEIISR